MYGTPKQLSTDTTTKVKLVLRLIDLKQHERVNTGGRRPPYPRYHAIRYREYLPFRGRIHIVRHIRLASKSDIIQEEKKKIALLLFQSRPVGGGLVFLCSCVATDLMLLIGQMADRVHSRAIRTDY